MSIVWVVLIAVLLLIYWPKKKPNKQKQKHDQPDFAPTVPSDQLEQDFIDQPLQSDGEGYYSTKGLRRSPKKTLRLRYCDANNNVSERLISARAYDPTRKTGLLVAYCHLRKAERAFRFDRMIEVVDTETGEIIVDLQHHLNDVPSVSN